MKDCHHSITPARVREAAAETRLGLEPVGFCTACGARNMLGNLPARLVTCEECGSRRVHAATELVFKLNPRRRKRHAPNLQAIEI